MIKILKQFIVSLSRTLIEISNKLIILFSEKGKGLPLQSLGYSESGRYHTFTFTNPTKLTDKNLLRAIFESLMNETKFLEFGEKKVIIADATASGHNFNLHPNVLITNQTPFEKYWKLIKKDIARLNIEGYPLSVIHLIHVKVWNVDLYSNSRIKITRDVTWKPDQTITLNLRKKNLGVRQYHTGLNYIKPLKNKYQINPGILSALDIETVNYKGNQIPVCISLAYSVTEAKLFLLDTQLAKTDINSAIDTLWKGCFEFLIKFQPLFKNILVHNLGSFDGLFIYKALSKFEVPGKVGAIIDDKNKFIQIELRTSSGIIQFKDSYRIFPVSLENLCINFNVPGKISKYNPDFNSLALFDKPDLLDQFKTYSLQDSISLLNALLEAQKIYLAQHNVDISTILSTSTLSLKIFRTNFLKHDIPVLKPSQDQFIRKSYFGGATDYYKAFAQKLRYYDVNSLYPLAMTRPMPFKLIRLIKDMSNISLADFFGFCLVEVETPKNILKPLLPYKHEGKTIYPTGNWIGVYFSEELKALEKYGYKFKLIKGYEFSQIDLFSEYVRWFYLEKKVGTGSKRFIAKMHLNQLYGIFGRRSDVIETINVYNDEIPKYIVARVVKSIIEIDDTKSVLLLSNNVNSDILSELNSVLEIQLKKIYTPVKNNVALAAAITAYARIHMMEYKLDPGCVYSDTDSVFTTSLLPENDLGSDLGLFKDEMKGLVIEEGYFLGIKKYGYWYLDENGKRIEKSTFAGVTKNSITWDEVIKIFKGSTIIKYIPIRFFKSFKNLNIKIDDTSVSVRFTPDKVLRDNVYYPINVFNLNHECDNRTPLQKLFNKLKKFLKTFF